MVACNSIIRDVCASTGVFQTHRYSNGVSCGFTTLVKTRGGIHNKCVVFKGRWEAVQGNRGYPFSSLTEPRSEGNGEGRSDGEPAAIKLPGPPGSVQEPSQYPYGWGESLVDWIHLSAFEAL